MVDQIPQKVDDTWNVLLENVRMVLMVSSGAFSTLQGNADLLIEVLLLIGHENW